MKIAVGSDHRGYEMKEQVKAIIMSTCCIGPEKYLSTRFSHVHTPFNDISKTHSNFTGTDIANQARL